MWTIILTGTIKSRLEKPGFEIRGSSFTTGKGGFVKFRPFKKIN
ncbi:hypothetical protein DCCM_3920 [Desulfocucumis palustris]|uniref:Uncharacterized protein n=1 Tax=Desulfocucumis palustris TaxID=1898651 RepID=A0A2L2XF69_9FIRM|nr:hypothetical protein DCCM_3920 [Desulfocucumis palustris]